MLCSRKEVGDRTADADEVTATTGDTCALGCLKVAEASCFAGCELMPSSAATTKQDWGGSGVEGKDDERQVGVGNQHHQDAQGDRHN